MGNQICGEQCNPHEIEAGEFYDAIKITPNQTNYPLNQSLNTKPKVNDSQSYHEIPVLPTEMQDVFESKHHFYMPFQQNNFSRRKFGNQIYQGQLNNNAMPHGLGKIFKSDGSLCVGYFQDGKAQGEGLFVFKDGSYFQGQLHDNMAHCLKGRYCSKDFKYEGQFKANTFDGEGKEQSPQHTFLGTYFNGKRTFGELRWWKADETSQVYCFYGKFDENQQFTQQGVLKQPTGRYTGNFFQGKKHGFGIYEYTNKLKYEGEYAEGAKQGQGKICLATNGNLIYEGGWKNNLPDGQGYKFSEQNKKTRVFYKDGIDILNLRDQNRI